MPSFAHPRHELHSAAETRCKHIPVRSNAAPTTMDGGSAGFAGADTCHAAYGHSNRVQFMSLIVNGAAVSMSDKNVVRPTIGVGVLVWRDKQLLLGKRLADKQETCWQFPGGHLENSESVIDCAVREVREETSLKVQSLRHLGFTNNTFVMGQRPYITLLVSCDYKSGVAQTLEPDKCEQWLWFDYRNLPAPLFKPIPLFMSQCDDLYAQHCVSLVLA